MARALKSDCPWCGTKSVGFTPASMACWQENVKYGVNYYTDVFAICGRCDRGVIVLVQDHHSSPDTLQTAGIEGVYPAPPSEDAPRFTPERAKGFFQQGMSSLHIGNPDAAGAMFRKSLESGLKQRFSSNKRNLIDKIKDAASKGLITDEMADWADHIRISGNEAVHDDDYTMEQAKALRVFTELVLIYLFELPGRLTDAKKKSTDDQNNHEGDDKSASL